MTRKPKPTPEELRRRALMMEIVKEELIICIEDVFFGGFVFIDFHNHTPSICLLEVTLSKQEFHTLFSIPNP